jgi:hypothetical protein
MHTLMQAGFVPSIPLPLSARTVLRMFDAGAREVDVFVRYPVPFDEAVGGFGIPARRRDRGAGDLAGTLAAGQAIPWAAA